MEVWNEYRTDSFVQSHEKVYNYESFAKIWREVFPNVKIREYKNVTGKCEICEACKKMMSQSKSRALRLIVPITWERSYSIIKEEERPLIVTMKSEVLLLTRWEHMRQDFRSYQI